MGTFVSITSIITERMSLSSPLHEGQAALFRRLKPLCIAVSDHALRIKPTTTAQDLPHPSGVAHVNPGPNVAYPSYGRLHLLSALTHIKKKRRMDGQGPGVDVGLCTSIIGERLVWSTWATNV